MITRKQYMDNSRQPNAHREYYAQFVTPAIKQRVLQAFGLDVLRRSFQCDEHFNDDLTPLRRWDALHLFTSTNQALHECGDWLSLGTQVCILKEAARQLVEEQTK